jgi:hypothetical protein
MGATYAALGTPLAHAASIIKFVNLGTGNAFLSTDGTNDMDIIPAGGFALYDLTSDSPPETGSVFMKAGTQVYAKSSVAGSIYFVVMYVKRYSYL